MDEIIAHYTEAIGGAEKIRQMNTLVTHGEYREGRARSHRRCAGRRCGRIISFRSSAIRSIQTRISAKATMGAPREYYKDPGIILRTVGKKLSGGNAPRIAIDGSLVNYGAKGSMITFTRR